MVPNPRMPLHGLRILVVEDQILIAMDLQATLEEHGATVIGPFARLDVAMEAVSSRLELDAAILDVDLGDHAIFPLADRLWEQGVPFVFHTGHADLDSLRARYDDITVMLKPTLPEEIAHRVSNALRGVRT